jgi:hypothetical protein
MCVLQLRTIRNGEIRVGSVATRQRTAVHETGHAVAAFCLELEPKEITIHSDGFGETLVATSQQRDE